MNRIEKRKGPNTEPCSTFDFTSTKISKTALQEMLE